MSLLRGSGHGPRGFPQFLDTTEQRRSLTGTLAQSVKRPRRTVKKRAKFRVTFARSLSSLRSRHSTIRGRVASSRAMLIGPVIDRARKSAPSRASLSHLRFSLIRRRLTRISGRVSVECRYASTRASAFFMRRDFRSDRHVHFVFIDNFKAIPRAALPQRMPSSHPQFRQVANLILDRDVTHSRTSDVSFHKR